MAKGGVVLAVGLLTLVAAMGGCVGGGEGKDADPSPTDATRGTGDGNNTADGGNGTTNATAPNTAPTLEFAADLSNGTAPVNITFTFNATDAEGDDLEWTLDGNGDGTNDASGSGSALPGNLTLPFDVPGNFTATFNVSDGNVSVNQTINITILAGVLAPLQFTGSISGVWVGDGVVGAVSEYLPPGQEQEHPFDLKSVPAKITFNLGWDQLAGYDLDIVVYAPDGTEAGSQANVNVPGDDAEDPLVIEDAKFLSQLGAWKIVVYAGAALQCDYTVDVLFE